MSVGYSDGVRNHTPTLFKNGPQCVDITPPPSPQKNTKYKICNIIGSVLQAGQNKEGRYLAIKNPENLQLSSSFISILVPRPLPTDRRLSSQGGGVWYHV